MMLTTPLEKCQSRSGAIMPKLDGILETCIHTEGHDVLLVFKKGATGETVRMPGGGVIPGHAGDGTLHVAFAIGKDQLAAWEERLAAKGVAIEGAHTWTR